ncbi:hypothetical protein DID80_01575 [Candidatus Marinamargulisbacteria bacterium SCGC AAA071-K20]|nr:hypothetical protein DID80_01575 [Candidatus Marinamargulisbacteria bacterium SCGC AAA071-K20]
MKNWLKELYRNIFPSECTECKTLQESPICKKCIQTPFKDIHIKKVILSDQVQGDYIFSYNFELIKKALYLIKYQANKSLATLLSSLIATLNLSLNDKIVIPIPSSKDREKDRGFDHVLSLFGGLSNKHSLSIFPCLERQNNTPPLNALNKQKRQDLLKNIFRPNKDLNCNYLYEKEVLLVDDIITTGTSMKEAISVIKEFKPKSISVLSMCYTELNHD